MTPDDLEVYASGKDMRLSSYYGHSLLHQDRPLTPLPRERATREPRGPNRRWTPEDRRQILAWRRRADPYSWRWIAAHFNTSEDATRSAVDKRGLALLAAREAGESG
jgi:hypothetical protein